MMRSSEQQRTLGRPRLVMIEGIMGSGKSSTAKYIESYLRQRGVSAQLWQEGDVDHPADFESVACLESSDYVQLAKALPEYQTLLQEIAIAYGERRLVHYGKEKHARGEHFPDDLYAALTRYDIYNELSLPLHQDLVLERWGTFADRWQRMDSTAIFECCYLQNPVCKFLAQHNAQPQDVMAHIERITQIVRQLNPVLIYLRSSNIPQTIRLASQERPKEWLDFVVLYHTEQAYGKAHGLRGLDGFLEFLAARQELELGICRRFPGPTLVLDDSECDWSERLDRLSTFLDNAFVGVN